MLCSLAFPAQAQPFLNPARMPQPKQEAAGGTHAEGATRHFRTPRAAREGKKKGGPEHARRPRRESRAAARRVARPAPETVLRSVGRKRRTEGSLLRQESGTLARGRVDEPGQHRLAGSLTPRTPSNACLFFFFKQETRAVRVCNYVREGWTRGTRRRREKRNSKKDERRQEAAVHPLSLLGPGPA